MNANQINYAYDFLVSKEYVSKQTISTVTDMNGKSESTIDHLVLVITGLSGFVFLLLKQYPELLGDYLQLTTRNPDKQKEDIMSSEQMDFASKFLIEEGYTSEETMRTVVCMNGMSKETIDGLTLTTSGQPDFISLVVREDARYSGLLAEYQNLQPEGEHNE